MNDLSKVEVLASTSLTLIDELEDAVEFAKNEKSQNTRVAYASDFSIFTCWCAQKGVCHLPASSDTAAAFLAASAREGLRASTIGRRCSAIGYAHRLAGLPSPIADERVRAVVRGIRRSIGVAPNKKTPATHDVITKMLSLCDDSLKGKRDAALLSLGFAGALRRSELVALQVEDLTEVTDGLRVRITRSKTDQEGLGCDLAIPHGYYIRPVERLRAWLDAAQISEGAIFRRVLKGGQKIGPNALSPLAASDVIKRLAEGVGLDPSAYAGHSLRSGFLTSAAESGASLLRMADQSRHASLDCLRGYVRSADLFKAHAGAAFL